MKWRYLLELNELKTFVQQHFTDGLVVVIGSGLSAAEGIPGMPALANHLNTEAARLTDSFSKSPKRS